MNKKNIILLLMLFGSITGIKAQKIVSSSGNYQETTSGSLSYTIGEPITETRTNGNIITQGFQQTQITITNVTNPEQDQLNITVFPNPANEYVTVRSSEMGKLQIQLCNVNGEILFEKKNFKHEMKINMISYPKGIYFIKIANNKSENSFKIIKQ